MEFLYLILANIVVALHVGYVSFVALGLLLILLGWIFGWEWIRNRWFRGLHLAAIFIVAAETVIEMTCPLTTWENDLRQLAGAQAREGDFIGRFLHNLIFLEMTDDHWIFKVMYFGSAALVILLLFLAPPRWKRNSPQKSEKTQAEAIRHVPKAALKK